MANDPTDKPTQWTIYCMTCSRVVDRGSGAAPTTINVQEATVARHIDLPGRHDLQIRKVERITEGI